jgi:hypothetical protein
MNGRDEDPRHRTRGRMLVHEVLRRWLTANPKEQEGQR